MSKLRVQGAHQVGAMLLLLALPLAARTPVATTPVAEPVASTDTPVAAEAPAADSAPVPTATVAADDPSALPSEIMPRASKSLLLDVVKTSSAFFAVGERGHILRSSDGQAWTQVEVPTRSTLTTITAVGDLLWAAGHDGVIVNSADGGNTWKAQRRDPYFLAPGQTPDDRDPRQGAPILDILFTDSSNGIAVGAHSLMLVTHDGGTTWTPRRAIAVAAPTAAAAPMEGDIFSEADLQLEDEADPHLNAITRLETGALVVVGERGTFLRSMDGGANWQRLSFPYKGSMFGVLSLGGGRLLAYGLRGNVYESSDLGSSWTKVPTQGNVNLMGGTALTDGGAVLTGANGAVLVRQSFAAPFAASTFKNATGETPALAGVVATGDGDYVLVGDKGVERYHLQ